MGCRWTRIGEGTRRDGARGEEDTEGRDRGWKRCRKKNVRAAEDGSEVKYGMTIKA
jgi:hypothetical protein